MRLCPGKGRIQRFHKHSGAVVLGAYAKHHRDMEMSEAASCPPGTHSVREENSESQH